MIILVPLIMLFTTTLMTNTPEEVMFYMTHWGVMLATFGVLFTIKSAKEEGWKSYAIITSQLSLSFGFIIVPLFWLVLAPTVFKPLGWKGHDLYLRIHFFQQHTAPLAATLVNIIMSDFQPL